MRDGAFILSAPLLSTRSTASTTEHSKKPTPQLSCRGQRNLSGEGPGEFARREAALGALLPGTDQRGPLSPLRQGPAPPVVPTSLDLAADMNRQHKEYSACKRGRPSGTA